MSSTSANWKAFSTSLPVSCQASLFVWTNWHYTAHSQTFLNCLTSHKCTAATMTSCQDMKCHQEDRHGPIEIPTSNQSPVICGLCGWSGFAISLHLLVDTSDRPCTRGDDGSLKILCCCTSSIISVVPNPTLAQQCPIVHLCCTMPNVHLSRFPSSESVLSSNISWPTSAHYSCNP